MNRETAKATAQRYRDLHPGSTVRVVKQTTANGSLNGATYRVVCDRLTMAGRRAKEKTRVVSRRLLAGWGAQVSPDLWESIPSRLAASQAEALRAELEPQLPEGWRFPKDYYTPQGKVIVMQSGKPTLVSFAVGPDDAPEVQP